MSRSAARRTSRPMSSSPSEQLASDVAPSALAPVSTGVLENAAIELNIPARSEHVKVARVAVAAVASRMRFTFDEVEDIKLAVAEACNNAIVHGVPAPGIAPRIDITLLPHADRLEIRVSDHGRMEEPPTLEVARPVPVDGYSRDVALPEGGLGLMLIRSLMDEVELLGGPDVNTTLRMSKRVKHGRVASPVAR